MLTNKNPNNQPLKAIFIPTDGIALAGYRCDQVEVITQSKAFSTLATPSLANDLSWEFYSSQTQLKGCVNSPKRDLLLRYEARLLPTGLLTYYSIAGLRSSHIGLCYHIQLPKQPVLLSGEVGPNYFEGSKWQPMPPHFTPNSPSHLDLSINRPLCCTFLPQRRKNSEEVFHLILNAVYCELHIEFAPLVEQESMYQVIYKKDSSSLILTLLSTCSEPKPSISIEAKLQIFPIKTSFC